MGLVRLPGTTKIYKVDWDHFRPQNFYMYEGPVVAFMTQGQKGPWSDPEDVACFNCFCFETVTNSYVLCTRGNISETVKLESSLQ